MGCSPSRPRRFWRCSMSGVRSTGPTASSPTAAPTWAEYTPNSMWIYDTTHFPAAGMAVLIIEDLVSRK